VSEPAAEQQIPTSSTPDPRRRRRAVVISVLAAVVVAVVAVVVVFAVNADRVGTGDVVNPPAITGTPTPSPIITDPAEALPERDPVAGDAPVEIVSGVTVSLGALEAVDGEANAPGETAGPAVRFTVTIVNDSDASIDLSTVVVTAYSGADRVPAEPLTEPGAVPFESEVAAGDTATATFVYTVPVEQRDDVTIIVDYQAGVPAAVFQVTAPR